MLVYSLQIKITEYVAKLLCWVEFHAEYTYGISADNFSSTATS